MTVFEDYVFPARRAWFFKVEGCVRETFGALTMLVQAEHVDREVGDLFRRLARDELRYAALAVRALECEIARGGVPFYGGVWKIYQPTKVPRLSIHHNVFRMDKDARGWIPLMPIKGIVTSCSDNVIVWLGTGPFPGDMSELSHCLTVTTDVAVWNTAVTNWKARHPE